MRRKAPGPRWETPDPPGVCGTYGDAVIRHSRRHFGREFGPWQAYVTRKMLRYDKNRDLIARIALLSTGRQNGKTVIVQGLFAWMMDEGRQLKPFRQWTEILAAAHDAKQARKMYDRVRADVDDSDLAWDRTDNPDGIKTTKAFGIQAGPIAFDTVTGQPGSTRGSTAGAIAWDEVLTQKDHAMWEALAPTQSAQRSPLMLLTSTAGMADSVVLRQFYDLLKAQATGERAADPKFYGAWWESENIDAGTGDKLTKEDWRQIGQANPGYGDGRLQKDAIVLDHAILPPDSWRRERLNHFVDAVAPGAFNMKVWAALRTPEPLAGLEGPYAMAVDVQPGWDRATVTVAGLRDDGRVGVEVFRDLRPTEGNPITAERVIEAAESFPQIDRVLVIVTEGASAIGPSALRRAQETGYPWEVWKPGLVVEACMDVTEMILAGRLAVDDPLLTAQIELAARRDVGQDGAFRFSRKDSLGAIDGVMAMTFSAHAIVALGGYPTIS